MVEGVIIEYDVYNMQWCRRLDSVMWCHIKATFFMFVAICLWTHVNRGLAKTPCGAETEQGLLSYILPKCWSNEAIKINCLKKKKKIATLGSLLGTIGAECIVFLTVELFLLNFFKVNWTAKETCHFCQRPHTKIHSIEINNFCTQVCCNNP